MKATFRTIKDKHKWMLLVLGNAILGVKRNQTCMCWGGGLFTLTAIFFGMLSNFRELTSFQKTMQHKEKKEG